MQDSDKLNCNEQDVELSAKDGYSASLESNVNIEASFEIKEQNKVTGLVFEEINGEEASCETIEPNSEEQKEEAEGELNEETVEEDSNLTNDGQECDAINKEADEEKQHGLEGVIKSEFVGGTYVPRFTEVTERRYRFVDEKKYSKPVRVTADKATSEDYDQGFEDKDVARYSTAEIDSDKDSSAVLIETSSSNASDKSDGEGVDVFKFKSVDTDSDSGVSIDGSDASDETEVAKIDFTNISDENDLKDVLRDGSIDESVPEWEEGGAEEQLISRLARESSFSNDIAVPEESLPENERPVGAGEKIVFVKGDKKGEGYFSQRESFKDKFLDKIMATKLRFVVLIILGVITVFFENIYLPYISKITSSLSAYSHFSSIIELCLVGAMLLIVLPECLRGITLIGKKVFSPELSIFLSAIAIIAYTVSSAYYISFNTRYLGSVFFVVALSAVYSTLCMHKAEFSCFKVISEKGTRYAVDTRETRLLARENVALDGAIDETKSVIARDFKTNYISKFFKNSANRIENSKNNAIVFAIAIVSAVLSGLIIYFFYDKNISTLLLTIASVISLGIPPFFMVTHKYTHKKLQDSLYKEKSAIVSEKYCYDCDRVDVITFDDTEVFGADDVVFKGVTLCDRSGDFHKVMKKMASLFAGLGGPLAKIFSNAINTTCAPAVNVIIEEDGVYGYVDGAKVMAGSAEFIERHGIKVPGDRSLAITSTKTMYGSDGRIVFAKFSIQYSFSEEFAFMLQEFDKENIVPLIYTRDPNVNDNLVAFLSGGRSKVRVMRKLSTIPQKEVVYKSLSAGIVSFSGKSGTVDAILKAKKYVRLQLYLSTFELITASLGCILAVGLNLFMPITYSYPIAFALWHIGLWIAMTVISNKMIDSDKKGLNEKDE